MTNNKQELSSFIKSETSSNKYSFNGSGSKRLSFIDKGKSWAKQLIKSNRIPNSPSLTAHKSFESCDSGIDVNSYSSNSSKISTSSSCSFITSFQSETPSTSLSNSNSSYLVSPVDESGYLVPIMSKPMVKKLPFRKASNSQLIRSFSTRSAYSTQHNNNQNVLTNRATICEEIRYNDADFCIRCNSRLNIRKGDSAFSFNQPVNPQLKSIKDFSGSINFFLKCKLHNTKIMFYKSKKLREILSLNEGLSLSDQSESVRF
ncbi:hypothetical protein BpHYR1_049127 [Brachionus plicatilis]|uniref:Uncharacterized protein n=1 Tax=Brachionus plicatilis TaxID=10195 RepID=A0A3M7SKR5_BRAPC|nr:hypothetical protein BpHYR1_049127 [Brachionus plicatilis]